MSTSENIMKNDVLLINMEPAGKRSAPSFIRNREGTFVRAKEDSTTGISIYYLLIETRQKLEFNIIEGAECRKVYWHDI